MRDGHGSERFAISIQVCYASLGSKHCPFTMKNVFLIYRWRFEDRSYVLGTGTKLLSLRITLETPSMSPSEDTRKGIWNWWWYNNIEIVAEDHIWLCGLRKRATLPIRVRLTVSMEDLRFDHRVQMYSTFIPGRGVLHMAHETAHCRVAAFLRK